MIRFLILGLHISFLILSTLMEGYVIISKIYLVYTGVSEKKEAIEQQKLRVKLRYVILIF